MQCKVEGCDREAHYKAACLCQKHYSRLWRNGTTDVKRKARDRFEGKDGYIYVYAPFHFLTPKGQTYISEQRKVLYDKIGPGPMNCEICGVGMTWKTCQADHIDEDTRNNDSANIRPLCLRCNVWRSMPPAAQRVKGAVILTFDGETKTAHEWARDPRVQVSGGTIKNRKRAGMTDEQALFGAKVTHNGNLPKPAPRKTQFMHQRKNAVAITIDGVTMTAAEWAREPGVTVSESGIIWRIRNGWEPRKAVFQKGRFA